MELHNKQMIKGSYYFQIIVNTIAAIQIDFQCSLHTPSYIVQNIV